MAEPKQGLMDEQQRSVFLTERTLKSKVRMLILGRMALVFLILVAGSWWSYYYLDFDTDPIPNRLFLLFIVYSILTASYLFFLRFNSEINWQVRTQFVIDILFITWLVWGTGGPRSPYITLYIFLISAAGFFLSRVSVHFIALGSAASFTLMSVLTSQSLDYSITGEVAPSRPLQLIAFNDAAFLLVGLLASRVAGRSRIREELVKVEADFADLNVLHARILESIKSGLITTDLQGKVYAFNRAAEEISGMRAADVVGQSVFSVFGDEIRSPIEISLGGVQADEFSAPHFEAGIRHAITEDAVGTPQTRVACSVSSLVGKSGDVTGLIIAFQDMTELQAMEETLRRSDRLAAVGRMAAGLAHEIRNPLGSMSSALQFMSEKVQPETEDAELMSVVLRESDRLNRIITDFLTYARPQAAGVAGKGPEQVEIGEAISDCLALLRHDPAVLDSHIFDFTRPETPIRVRAKESQIKQIFWNLLQNGVNAMPDGGKITLELRNTMAKHLKVVVSDTGCGISRENLKQLFEPFQCGARGTGIGLSIVHTIVTELGGRIDVKSEVGKGTKITLDLPK